MRKPRRKPFKKLSTAIMAGLALLLLYSIIYANIPTVGAKNAQTYFEHTVEAGETLWQVAQEYRPDADPREIIWQIQEASDCTALIRAGQRLLIPGGN